jgi:hypothetical protein
MIDASTRERGMERAGRILVLWTGVVVLGGCLLFSLNAACVWADAEQGQASQESKDKKPEEKKAQPSGEAAQPKAKAGAVAPAPKKSQAPLSFTNDDLKGSSAPRMQPKAPADAASSEDPLKPFRDREAAEASRAERVQKAQDKIKAIQSRLDYLRQKRQAILDPYNIMPAAPTAADRGDSGLGARELLAKVDEEIKIKEAELADAQKELAAGDTKDEPASKPAPAAAPAPAASPTP